MWKLGRIVRNSAELPGLFEKLPADQLMSQLETSEDGRNFLQQFKEYLDEFGWRSDAFELADRPWREDPTVPMNAIQGYMRLDDDHDPDVKYQQAVQRREELLASARESLAGQPEILGPFNHLNGRN